MDENVAAPAPTGEAAPLTTNPEPVAPPAAPEPVFAHEEAVAIKRFLDSNGGLEGVKRTVSARQAPAPQPQPELQPEVQPQPSEPSQPLQVPQEKFTGGIGMDELMIQGYFERLAQRPEYASIADEIRSGAVLKQLVDFDIQPVRDGRIDNKKITRYLDLYSKTKPAAPTEAQVTPTPTVDYIQISGDKIDNYMDAMNILAQSRAAEMQGAAPHPLKEQASQFVNQTLTARQNLGRREHKTIDPNKKA